MEEKYQLKEGCLTIQMPKELDHHEAGRRGKRRDFCDDLDGRAGRAETEDFDPGK